MQTLTMAALIQMQRSLQREAMLRDRARRAELDPSRRQEAKRLFRMASAVRQGRHELMERCGLI